MTTEQTAQQLELAAQILRTGHPFEVRHDASDRWHASLGVNPAQAVLQNWCLRPVLATPPDNRPLHNPDNLTAEAVGVGYRLALPGESGAVPHDFWDGDTWKKAKLLGPAIFAWCCRSCRLPLSVPWPEPADPYAELKAAHAAGKVIQYRSLNCPEWQDQRSISWNPPDAPYKPEYRIKPTESAKPEPAFQLPPCAPGIRWHREDGWTADDLPQGYRPCVVDEREAISGYMESLPDRNSGLGWVGATYHSSGLDFYSIHHRTTRPLTFEHAGKRWTWHRPGDPMPCDGERVLHILLSNGEANRDFARAKFWDWKSEDEESDVEIIGWRYADEKKTVPLGPEDVRCGDEIMDEYQLRRCVITVSNDGVSLGGEGFIAYIHLTGRKIRRRDSDEFVPCSKTLSA